MCIKYMSLTNFDLHRLCKRMDLPIVGVFSKDELDPIPQQIGTYYINMSDAHEAGTHLFVLKSYAMKIETITKVKNID